MRKKTKLVGFYRTARSKKPKRKVYRTEKGALILKSAGRSKHRRYIRKNQRRYIHFYKVV